MYTAQNIFPIANLTFHQCHMMFTGDVIHIPINLKFSILGWHLCTCFPYDMFFMDPAVILQIFDRNKFQVVLLRQLPEILCPHHRSVLFHDFTADSTFFQSGKTHQINRCLGMTISYQHTSMPCHQRKYMPRSSKVLRFRSFFCQAAHSISSLCC